MQSFLCTAPYNTHSIHIEQAIVFFPSHQVLIHHYYASIFGHQCWPLVLCVAPYLRIAIIVQLRRMGSNQTRQVFVYTRYVLNVMSSTAIRRWHLGVRATSTCIRTLLCCKLSTNGIFWCRSCSATIIRTSTMSSQPPPLMLLLNQRHLLNIFCHKRHSFHVW